MDYDTDGDDPRGGGRLRQLLGAVARHVSLYASGAGGDSDIRPTRGRTIASKRDLGVSYLLGSGLGLIATLTWFYLLSDNIDVGLLIATVTAGILSGAFVFIGYWMYHTRIPGDTVWTVSKWSAAGLSVPVLLGLAVMHVNPASLFRTVIPGVFINLIAVGGVVGLLLGLVLEMHREQADLRQLNQRNKVLNRVLRHNIRNDMSVMQLHLDALNDEVGRDGDGDGTVEALRHKIHEVVSTSDMARRIDELDSRPLEEDPVDLVEIVDERVEIVRSTHPHVTVSVDVPDEAWVAGGPTLESVVDNLVENAIEHNEGDAHVDVSVDDGPPVRLRVADDGPGIPDAEVEMLENGDETQLEHGTGLGLWLVKWTVERLDGDLRFESSSAGGTRVVVELPAADRPRVPATG